ncbi:hypothetical protein [Brevundimonas sp.]|uniref:hypothetical protein n=1 Tax=Brevundimonas sp. TaxID=1871086 RepID=UPI00286B41C9|nr:hypothetical protein [Brevundimonas sp.]
MKDTRMIRTVSVVAIALTLAACQPSGQGEAAPSGQATLPSGDAMPATYDWYFTPHGGTGELDFGDGDWAEGISVFGLSCLPETKTVQMNWGREDAAVLTSGTATGTFRPAASVPTDHPVLTALKASGAIDVGLSGADMRLVAKDTGKAEITAFFDYCDKGIHPAYTPEAIAAAEAELAAAEAAQGTAAETAPAAEAPAEPAAPAGEAPKT